MNTQKQNMPTSFDVRQWNPQSLLTIFLKQTWYQAADSVLCSWRQTWRMCFCNNRRFCYTGSSKEEHISKYNQRWCHSFCDIAYRIISCVNVSLQQKEDISQILGQQPQRKSMFDPCRGRCKEEEEGRNPVTIYLYRSIFYSDYN